MPLLDPLNEMLSFPFMVNAFRAGTVVAIVSATVGWFMVLRRQSFAGHTLAVVGFPGAAGAVLLGISTTYGLFAFAVAAALVIAVTPARGRGRGEETAVTGTVQAFALACGFLFLSLGGGFLGSTNALLFGTFLGITHEQVVLLTAFGAAALVVLAALARPLMFASVDPDVARARGVPVRALGVVFLVLLGVTAAEASQITGVLLVFTLLVAPAATAQLLTARPWHSIAWSVVIALATTWIALTCAYFSDYPIGFWLTSVAFAGYLLAQAWSRLGRTLRARPVTEAAGTDDEETVLA